MPGRPADIPVEVWEEIVPLVSGLAAIYEARGIPEHAPLWGAIRINIQTFANQVRRDTRLEGPDHRPKPRRRSDSPKS